MESHRRSHEMLLALTQQNTTSQKQLKSAVGDCYAMLLKTAETMHPLDDRNGTSLNW